MKKFQKKNNNNNTGRLEQKRHGKQTTKQQPTNQLTKKLTPEWFIQQVILCSNGVDLPCQCNYVLGLGNFFHV